MWIRQESNGTILSCKIHPSARKDSIDGVRDEHLSIHLTAPPVEGKANKALQKLLSKLLDLAKTRIVILSGEKAKTKVLLLEGISAVDVKKRLGLEDSSA